MVFEHTFNDTFTEVTQHIKLSSIMKVRLYHKMNRVRDKRVKSGDCFLIVLWWLCCRKEFQSDAGEKALYMLVPIVVSLRIKATDFFLPQPLVAIHSVLTLKSESCS